MSHHLSRLTFQNLRTDGLQAWWSVFPNWKANKRYFVSSGQILTIKTFGKYHRNERAAIDPGCLAAATHDVTGVSS